AHDLSTRLAIGAAVLEDRRRPAIQPVSQILDRLHVARFAARDMYSCDLVRAVADQRGAGAVEPGRFALPMEPNAVRPSLPIVGAERIGGGRGLTAGVAALRVIDHALKSTPQRGGVIGVRFVLQRPQDGAGDRGDIGAAGPTSDG